METFTDPKQMVANPHYGDQKRKTLAGLGEDMIDEPIVALIKTINRLPHCFTLQSCYGHFVFPGQTDPQNLATLPAADGPEKVTYRMAYVCLCLDSGDAGKQLIEALQRVPAIDPQNIQFGCAHWFWDRQVNSYVLQVQPDRFKCADTATLGDAEARHIERVRFRFFDVLEKTIR